MTTITSIWIHAAMSNRNDNKCSISFTIIPHAQKHGPLFVNLVHAI